MKEQLKEIAKTLNQNNVVWALGASLMLHFYGIVESPNDIDILVSLEDAEKADNLLQKMGKKFPSNPNKAYLTKHFYEYHILGVDLDLMSGFIIQYEDEKTYEYVLEKEHIRYIDLDGVKIPLSPIEDWYLLYMLMPNRESKVQMIADYFAQHGADSTILQKRMQGDLPSEVCFALAKYIL